MIVTKAQYINFLIFHLIVISLGLLLVFSSLSNGIGFLIIVISYNLAFPLYSKYKEIEEFFDIWQFSFFLSILQIIPDWILVSVLNVLVFPEDGLVKIGPVAGYMWGLWCIAFVLIITTSLYFGSENEGKQILIAAITALVIFSLSEMTLWRLGSWYAVNVSTTFHIAHYIIIPEIILGINVLIGYRLGSNQSNFIRGIIIISTMIFYVGTIVTSYFFIEYL